MLSAQVKALMETRLQQVATRIVEAVAEHQTEYDMDPQDVMELETLLESKMIDSATVFLCKRFVDKKQKHQPTGVLR